MSTVLDRPPVHDEPPSPPFPGFGHDDDGDGRRRWSIAAAIGGFGAFVALILAVILIAASVGTGDKVATDTAAAPGDAAATVPAGQPVEVELGDLYIKPASITVAKGQHVTLHVTNKGAMQHDIVLDGQKAAGMIDPGKSATVDFGMIDKSTVAYCTVPGHRAAGMEMKINVAGAAAAAAATGSSTGSAAASNDAKIDPNATPSATWKAFDPKLQPAAGGVVHNLQFAAKETVHEVAPGVKQQVWTFNDQVPGPIVRVKLGDVVNLTLTNEGTMGHSIDFHASEVAPNVEMRTIQPGESLTYQFKAEHTGIWMYHCGTAPALHHIGNGMFGALIVDPPDLAPVDHEYVFVQSEWYLGPQGQPGDLTKMQNEQFDAVTFNGYYNQYKFSPIHVNPGEKVRAWVLDAGPSENSSFHIVGTVFDTVYKEGAYLLRGGPGAGGAQALDLQPAQGGFVEFTLDRPGTYTMVTHKFANVGKGALGTFIAGDAGVPMNH
jgi:nitrite reductase (NO-forming)